jgi:predicted ester cyclase
MALGAQLRDVMKMVLKQGIGLVIVGIAIGLLGAFLTAVPDNRLTVSRTVQQGETIVIEATYSGTHTGPLAGPDGSLPPTGLTFAFPYVDILTAREDKIVTRNIYWDNMTFLSQLGALPAAAA